MTKEEAQALGLRALLGAADPFVTKWGSTEAELLEEIAVWEAGQTARIPSARHPLVKARQ